MEEIIVAKEKRFSPASVVLFLLFALLFLGPIAVSLTPGVLLEAGKWVVIFCIGALAFLLWIFSTLRSRECEIPKSALLISGGLVLFTTFLSTLFSGSFILSFFGTGYDIVSFFPLLFLFILLYLFAIFFRDAQKITRALYVLSASFGVVFLVSALHHFYPDFPLLSFLAEPTANIFGKWHDFGIFSGLILTLTLLLYEMRSLKVWSQLLLVLLYLAGLLGVIAVNSFMVWSFLALVSFGIVVYRFIPMPERPRRIRVRALIVLLAALLFMLLGGPNQILGRIVNQYQLPPSDAVRLNWGPTLQIFGSVFVKDPIFGAGPGRFSNEWLLNRPESVNQSDYWNSSFDFGVGFIPTALITTGLLGFSAWLLFLLALVVSGIRAFFSWKNGQLSEEYRVPLFLSWAAALYLWLACVFAVPNSALLLLAFIATGFFLGALLGSGQNGIFHISFKKGERSERIVIPILIVFALLFVWRITATAAMYSSLKEFTLGMQMVQRGNFEEGLAYVKAAAARDPEDSYLRAIAELSLARLNLITSQKKELTPHELLEFQKIAGEAINSARAAVVAAPDRFPNWFVYGNVCSYLHSVRVSDAKECAIDQYAQADALFPTTPTVPFALARLEFVGGDLTQARHYLAAALRRKNDYTPALLMFSELEAKAGKDESAVQSARRARDLAPQDPSVHFELGLVSYFSQKPNYEESEAAFAKVLELVPDYANARYFLALAQASLGKREVALEAFLQLERENPENVELKKIIANLQAERPAGAGLFE